MKDYLELTEKQIIRLKNAIVLIDLFSSDSDDECAKRRDFIIEALRTLGYAVKIEHKTTGCIKNIEIVWEGFKEEK